MDVNQPVVITSIEPSGYPHAHAFDEVADTVEYGLSRLGYKVLRMKNAVPTDAPVILFGGHLLDGSTVGQLPASVIFYNLEQADPGARWMTGPYAAAMQHHEVWDFNEVSVWRLAKAGVAPKILWAPIGFVPELQRIPAAIEEDIDVLFYGSVNPRRQYILDRLSAAGIHVVHAFGIYGAERDALLARAKLVLNIHYYDSNIFEWVRVFYALANRKAVVSEDSILTAFDQGVEAAVQFTPYSHVVDACLALLTDSERRHALIENGLPHLLARPEERILDSVLHASSLFT